MNSKDKIMILEWITNNTNPNTLVMSRNKMKAYINSLITDDDPVCPKCNKKCSCSVRVHDVEEFYKDEE